MDSGIVLGVLGILVTILVGALFLSKKIKKEQNNSITIKAKDNSKIKAKDIVSGDYNSDTKND